MSLRDNTRYLQNRSLWQKSASTSRRQKPRAFTFIDGDSLLPTTIDLTKITRSRNAYRVEKSTPSDFVVEFEIGEYEEGLVTFDDNLNEEIFFNSPFTDTPIIVLTPEDDTSFGNYNVFCLAKSSASFQIATSVEYTGQMRYRAAYATSYPARVSSSFSSSFIVSGGEADTLNSSSQEFAGTFSTGILAPIVESRATPVFDGDPVTDTVDCNISIIEFTAVNTVDSGNVAGTVSATVVSTSIDYLVVLRYPILS